MAWRSLFFVAWLWEKRVDKPLKPCYIFIKRCLRYTPQRVGLGGHCVVISVFYIHVLESALFGNPGLFMQFLLKFDREPLVFFNASDYDDCEVVRMDQRYKVGNFIYMLRTGKGLTQEQLGNLLGVTNKAVSKWENGSAIPRLQLLPRLAETLGCTQEELFLGGFLKVDTAIETPEKRSPSAEYISVVERCDSCSHRACYTHKKLTCLHCGAALEPQRPYKALSLVISAALLILFIILGIFLSNYLTGAIFATGFPTAESAALHASLHSAFPHLKMVGILANQMILLRCAAAYLLLRYLLVNKLLRRYTKYKILAYPHAEDGKIVF